MTKTTDEGVRSYELLMDGEIKRWWIVALFVAYLCLAAIIPVFDDEFYYWCWSRELQWSYYDHPPLTAVLIRLSTTLFGNSMVGFRIPACIGSAFVVYVISRLTPSKPIFWGAMLSPLFTLGAVLITPDAPLVAFWAAYVWWLVELHRRLTPTSTSTNLTDSDLANSGPSTGNPIAPSEVVRQFSDATPKAEPEPPQGITFRWWLLGGAILGFGVLSKYTMGLAVPAAFVSLLLAWRPWREWLPGYIFHGVVAFAVASPILIYNIGQNFEPLLFQWRHVAEKSPSGLLSFGDFVGAQMLLFGTLPFTLFPWVCIHFRRLCRDPRLRLCACFYALPLAFFLYKSTQTRLQGNWAFVCFVSFWPLASDWYESVRASKSWRWSTASAFLPPGLAVLFLVMHGLTPLSVVPIQADRLYRQIAINSAGRELTRKIRAIGERLPIYTDTYQMTSLLRFHSLDAHQIDGLTRPSHFTRPPHHLTDVSRAYVVSDLPLDAKFSADFGPPEKLATVPVEFRGKIDRTLNLWLYSK